MKLRSKPEEFGQIGVNTVAGYPQGAAIPLLSSTLPRNKVSSSLAV
jgi:hypothetical protein